MSNILDRFTGNISPVALLVSSFFWSWFDIVPFSPALFSAASQRFDIAPIAISFISSAAVLAVFAASGALRSRVIGAKSFCVCSLLFGSLGSVFIYAGAAASPEFFIAGGILIGVYQSVGAVVAGSVATCQGTTNALVHLATALPFNIIAILLVVFLQPFPSVVFAVLLPLLAALCYAVFLVRGNNKAALTSVLAVHEERGSASPVRKRLLGCDPVFLIAVLAISASFGFVNYQEMSFAAAGSSADYASITIRAITASAVLVGYIFYSWRPYAILRAALVLMSVGLTAGGIALLIGWESLFAPHAVFLVGYVLFDLLIWAIIVMVGYGSKTSIVRIVCVTYAVDQFGIFAGTLAGIMVGGSVNIVVVQVVLGSVLLLLTIWLSNGENAVKDSMSAYTIEFAETDPDVSQAGDTPSSSAFSDAEVAQGRIDSLSARYFLTSREADVFALLATGRSVPYISHELCVSDNTVKTHIRHIYTKLDVHTRQELLDLIGA